VGPERLAATLHRLSSAPLELRAESGDHVFLKAASLARLVPWRQVRHIVSEGNYTRVQLEDGVAPLVPRPLKDWLALMPESLFFQAHRTAIVRLDAICEVVVEGEKRRLQLADGTRLPVSRSHWPALKAALERSS
jgi:DNA-binding LytR/AlgR family response regulator